MDSLKWIGFQILRKMKGRKPKRYENSDSEEISLPEESVEYDFITIQNATNNFSKKNRIGEGGFGVVYKDSTSRIMRTSRYIAPEYTLQGEISIKTDVYSFGMLILEIISGHRISNFQNEESTNDDELLSYAWTHWKGGSASNVIDPMLSGIKSPVDEITKCIHIALLCVQESVADRPKMIEVLQMLNKLSIRLPEPLDPGLFIRGSISSEASSQFTKNVKSISDQYDRKMQKKKAKSYAKTVEESSSSVEINPVESHLKYELITIQNATNNFSKANKLGEGGYWPIYKGKLENGLEVAVRKLSKYGNLEFKNEVTLIAKLQHRNLAWKQWTNGSSSNLIHPMLRGISSPVNDIIKCIQIALLCIQVEPEDRPTMSEVVQMLSNLSMSIPVPLAPPELAPPGLDDDCSTVCSSEGSINEMSVSEDDEYLRFK
nr:putative receptor-like protein kinase At4g00960 [Ipomoea batatas]